VPFLEQQGFKLDNRPLLGADYVRSLATGGGFSKKEIGRSYLHRAHDLLRARVGDIIWVYAELFPYLPASFERLVFRSGRPVVYDFDDAFFHQYDEHPSPIVRRALRNKFEALIGGAAACACGNAYLRDYAARFCERTIILPTVVDTDLYRPAGGAEKNGADHLTVGWIGSPSTFKYLRPLLPLLRELVESHGIRFRAVGAGAAAAGAAFRGMQLIDWSEAREVAEVQKMDIGIMPLPDEVWARGKSGYKLIQYLACGLPVVASPVGVNSTIVSPGVNGFLAENLEQWRAAILSLMESAELRRAMGEAGRTRVIADYSVAAQAPRFAALLNVVAARSLDGQAGS
jgi:glycosyltransferase involved in cell wall biosynthesis